MAKYSIYNTSDSVIASGYPKYNGAYGKPAYLEFTINSPSPIAFEVGCYVDYRGLRYKLYSVPEPKKQATSGSVGDAFVYANLQFHDATRELENLIFTDRVLAGGEYFFSSRESTSTYENLQGILNRLAACANELSTENWAFVKADGFDSDTDLAAVANEPQEFPISGQSILDACNKITDIYKGVGWIYNYDSDEDEHQIIFGGPNIRTAGNTTGPFEYGNGKGLISLKKYITNKDKLVTRLYAYGSERNMPLRHYNAQDICSADSVDIPNLMIPISEWGLTYDSDAGENLPDARKAYIEDAAIVAALGLIPRKVYFNNDENGDIYPSIKGMTIGEVENAIDTGTYTDIPYISPNRTIYPTDSERVDALAGATNPSDDGNIGDDTQRTITGSFFIPSASFTASLEEDGDDANIDQLIKEFAFSGLTTAGTFTFMPMNGNAIAYIVVDANDPNIGSAITWNNHTEFENAVRFKFRLVLEGIGESEYLECSYTGEVTVSGRTCYKYSVRLPNSINVTTTDKNISTIKARLRGGVVWETMFGDGIIKYTLGITTGSKLEDENAVDWSFAYTKVSRAKVRIKQIGFDLNDVVATNGAHGTLNILDGYCGGRAFTIKSCEYDSVTDSYTLTIDRVQDDSTGMLYPNVDFPLRTGDKFVLTDIYMPDLYVAVGEQKLLAAAQSYYAMNSKPQYLYTPEIDSAYLADAHAAIPRAGMFMQLKDSDITGASWEYILIDSVTIAEGESNIPIVAVTLRERLNVPSAT